MTAKRGWVLIVAMLAAGLFATAVRADDVDNPQYGAWAKFKPGSSETLSADLTMGPNTVHIDMTQTLVSVAADQIETQSLAKVQAMGHTNNPTPVSRTIKAKAPAVDIKETGAQDVKAMDKTFTCRVLEISGETAVASTPRAGTRPPPPGVKIVLYVSADVPGGLVKLESTTSDGKTNTFLLTGMEVK